MSEKKKGKDKCRICCVFGCEKCIPSIPYICNIRVHVEERTATTCLQHSDIPALHEYCIFKMPLRFIKNQFVDPEMYLNSWDEFEKAAQNLYLQDPMKVRYDMKYIHSRNLLKIKLTDNAVCLQYKTENQPEVKKVEKFINNLMRHMASKDHT